MTILWLDIGLARADEVAQLASYDQHLPADLLAAKIAQGHILVARLDGSTGPIVGMLRYNYFWDTIPFMNMLMVRSDLRGQGIGTHLVAAWETSMRAAGATWVLTSTLANERGQFLYRKLGYHDCGGLLLPNEPLEILLRKVL
ncbi:MAG: GNAT family N-acetyltransferase [Roseiflexaceae bacterium]